MTRSGVTYTPHETTEFENLVKWYFTEKYPDHIPWEGAVAAAIYAFYQIPKSWTKKKKEEAAQGLIFPMSKPDGDNIAKAVLDSLNGIAYRDDAHITDMHVMKRYSETPGTYVILMTDFVGDEDVQKSD